MLVAVSPCSANLHAVALFVCLLFSFSAIAVGCRPCVVVVDDDDDDVVVVVAAVVVVSLGTFGCGVGGEVLLSEGGRFHADCLCHLHHRVTAPMYVDTHCTAPHEMWVRQHQPRSRPPEGFDM
jgi:hypothetical protein